MTTELCQVSLMLIRENFGEVAQAVASLLIQKRSCSFHKMSELLNLDTKLVSAFGLWTLENYSSTHSIV